jgi:hypothetical protein
MVLHDGTRSDFLRAVAISAGFLSTFLDVLVLALFLLSCPAQGLSPGHVITSMI